LFGPFDLGAGDDFFALERSGELVALLLALAAAGDFRAGFAGLGDFKSGFVWPGRAL